MSTMQPTTTAQAGLNGEVAGVTRRPPPVLELEAVTKTYGEQPPVPALRGVNLTVHQGELVAIVGPSGSGKTTLLHVMGTLERPTSGSVRIDGVEVDRLDDRQLAAVRARRRRRTSPRSRARAGARRERRRSRPRMSRWPAPAAR